MQKETFTRSKRAKASFQYVLPIHMKIGIYQEQLDYVGLCEKSSTFHRLRKNKSK